MVCPLRKDVRGRHGFVVFYLEMQIPAVRKVFINKFL